MKKKHQLFTTTAALLLACSAMAQQSPYEFKCTDYIAVAGRSNGKFSYDDEANTFTIAASGPNNIAFQMNREKDGLYYISKEHRYFAVK